MKKVFIFILFLLSLGLTGFTILYIKEGFRIFGYGAIIFACMGYLFYLGIKGIIVFLEDLLKGKKEGEKK